MDRTTGGKAPALGPNPGVGVVPLATRPTSRASRYRSGTAAPAPDETASGLTASWLRAAEDTVNLLDLGETAGIEDAAGRIRRALTDPDLLTGKSFYR